MGSQSALNVITIGPPFIVVDVDVGVVDSYWSPSVLESDWNRIETLLHWNRFRIVLDSYCPGTLFGSYGIVLEPKCIGVKLESYRSLIGILLHLNVIETY